MPCHIVIICSSGCVVGRGRLSPEAVLVSSKKKKKKTRLLIHREREQVKRPWTSSPKHYSCILSSIALIQVYAGNGDWTPDLSSSQSVPAVTRLTLPSLRDFVASSISYKTEKVHCKTTEGNKSYRNDRRDWDDIHLLYWLDYRLTAYFQMCSFACLSIQNCIPSENRASVRQTSWQSHGIK